MMFWGHAPFWLPGMLFFILGKLFWLVLLGLLVWLVIRALTGRRQVWRGYPQQMPPVPPYQQPVPPYQQPSAMEILRQRFARGEIDATTFDQMRERLEASERPPTPPHDVN
ncbi:MAG: SHOCT domain-containing protein [Ktedonobacteraceae bacterium]|nr:SHOCT domain-containing protein [Ktedonobacteraceae bacterium]